MLNKHTMLKNEMSLSMLDADMLGFLKGMHKEWNKLLHRTDKASERIERLDTKFEDVQKFLRSFKGFGKSDRLSSTAKSPNTKRSTPRHSIRQHDSSRQKTAEISQRDRESQQKSQSKS